jgi:hypothetical protein
MNELQVQKPQEIIDIQPQLPDLLLRVIFEAEFDHGARKVVLAHGHSAEELMGIAAAIDAAEKSLRPATTPQRRACLLALLSVYPPRQADENMQKARFDVYHKTLSDLPPDILWDACLHCVAKIKFFPMPAEIREAAAAALNSRLMVVSKLRGLRDYERVEREVPQNLTEDDRARRKVQIEGWRRALAAGGLAENDKNDRSADVVAVVEPEEPEISDLATAILRARVGTQVLKRSDLAFLKEKALSDARRAWPWLKSRGWMAPKSEEIQA